MAKLFNFEISYLLKGKRQVDFHKDVEAETCVKAKSRALTHYTEGRVIRIKTV